MPHTALKLIPGVDANRTEALNEAAISSSDLIRFMPDRNGAGLPQKLGGWVKFPAMPLQVDSDIKALWAWANSDADNHLAIGTTTSLQVVTDDPGLRPITPSFYEIDRVVDFSTVNASSEVDIGDPGSSVHDTDNVFIMTHVAVGGVVLFGMYPCIGQTTDSYSIIARNVIGTPTKATATVVSGGVLPTFTAVANSPGITVALPNHGYNEGSTFPLLVPITVGGLVLGVGNYLVMRVVDLNNFIIRGDTAPLAAETVTINGGLVRFRYYVGSLDLFGGSGGGGEPGPGDGSGYGTSGYGRGGYGSGTSAVVVSLTSIGGGRSFNTVSATSSDTIVTLTHAGNYTIPPGSVIDVSNVVPDAYNVIEATVISSTANTVTYDAGEAMPGPITTNGILSVEQYAFPTTVDWTLDNLGDYLIACPEDGAVYKWSSLDGGPRASVIDNSPTRNKGIIAAMPQRQVIAYGSTFNDIYDPLLVRWNDINDPSDWVANATNQAGSFRLSNGSIIVGALQGNGQILLWTDIGIWSMQYVSLPLVYSFNEIGRGCGLIGKKAAVSGFGAVFWMSKTQFWKMDSGGLQPIQCPVWEKIFDRVDHRAYHNIRAGVNALFGEVWWFYPILAYDEDGNDISTGVPTEYVKFNTLINQWDYGTLSRTAWIDQSIYGPPLASGPDRYIYQHEMGKDADIFPMVSSFQTGYFALAEGDQLMFLDQLWPDMKWDVDGGNTTSCEVQITFYTAEYPGQTPRQHGPFTVTQAKKFITPRLRARLMSIKVSSSDTGSFWRLGNIRYRIAEDGKFL